MTNSKRTAILTLPAVAGVAAVTTLVDIHIDAHATLMFIEPTYFTPRVIVETTNIELVTPSVVTLTDPAVPGRYILITRNETPHTDMEFSVYYDTVHKDMFVIPSLELYAAMPYIKSAPVKLSAYGISFSGSPDSNMPQPIAGLPVAATLVNLAKYVSRQNKGAYYEKMVSPVYNYSSVGMHPSVYLNFGTPLTMFGTVNFSANINVFGYDSLFDCGPQDFGIQAVQDAGLLVVELPL